MDFRRYVEQNRQLGTNALIRGFRALGGKIGNERGREVIRDTKNIPKDIRKRTTAKKPPSFDDFIRNRQGGTNELIRGFRAIGGKIGNEAGREIVRSQRNLAKDETKDTIKMITTKKKYMHKYNYLVRFEYVSSGGIDFAYVTSKKKLLKSEVIRLFLQMFTEQQELEKRLMYVSTHEDIANVKVVHCEVVR